MIYNDFNGIKLSALGMGNMRLPVLNGNDSEIDVQTAKEMIAYCMKAGINYYDTAYDGYKIANFPINYSDYMDRIEYAIWAYFKGDVKWIDEAMFELQR